jgi:hypothetical protein
VFHYREGDDVSEQIFFNELEGPAQKRECLPRTGGMLLVVLLAFGIQVLADLGFADTAAAGGTRMGATYESTLASSDVGVSSSLDMRDDEYNSDYIFGMSKGVANWTIIPAMKPLFFLVTIPLDLAFLPFALIGGFF